MFWWYIPLCFKTISELTQEREGVVRVLRNSTSPQSAVYPPSMQQQQVGTQQHLAVELADSKAKIRRLRQELWVSCGSRQSLLYPTAKTRMLLANDLGLKLSFNKDVFTRLQILECSIWLTQRHWVNAMLAIVWVQRSKSPWDLFSKNVKTNVK